MVVVGGEGELDEEELKVMEANKAQKKGKKGKGNEDEICVDLENDSSPESVRIFTLIKDI